ncbi:DUF6221 family protein [Catenulispora subtropica]|uniref:Uncharacterized protein n=1 Tax=Catenulispora subtropica TaxID=450798 RepID=A0ABN2RIY3_9ACTN
MNQDIIAFVQARLDEDADIARRCDGDGCGRWIADGGTVDFCQYDLDGFHPTVARHVTRHDPERVLREVAARQRALNRHVPDTDDTCRHDGRRWPCPDLLDLAAPHAEHPAFDPGWSL